MGIATLLDAAVIAPAAALGLLGVWLGFARSLVAWPMRWLVTILGASAAALLAALYLVMNAEMAALLNLSGAVGVAGFAAAAFLIALVLLSIFMGNLRERVAVWTGQRRIGFVERVLGGLLGIACGAVLAAIAVACTPVLRVADDAPPWVRESVLLPHVRNAADAVGRALLPYLPYPNGSTRAER